ncbi:sigma factor G inhibitor Gin [Clostridium sp.]|uniref:sigma factor G inhibitor Gin n=1 Tax=Clostridium sp. TaxID=1506 RepID=UPI0039910EC1
MDIRNKICIICGRVGKDGILIRNKKICSSCEQKAIEAEVTSEFYEFYKNRIKENISGKIKEEC